jgi:hypothetical protein
MKPRLVFAATVSGGYRLIDDGMRGMAIAVQLSERHCQQRCHIGRRRTCGQAFDNALTASQVTDRGVQRILYCRSQLIALIAVAAVSERRGQCAIERTF